MAALQPAQSFRHRLVCPRDWAPTLPLLRGPAILSLLLGVGPATIVGPVIIIDVDAIERAALGARPHVLIKGTKTIKPALANPNPRAP